MAWHEIGKSAGFSFSLAIQKSFRHCSRNPPTTFLSISVKDLPSDTVQMLTVYQ
jgi:hypothetical protein